MADFDSSKKDKSRFALIEEEILDVWEKEKTFEQSIKQRQGREYYSFFDGPPFANGLPHFGHSLVTAIKDSMLRYKTMRGYYVPRRNGWDCHGLPVEFAIEKEFGISGKKQILDLGLEKFNNACRDSIFKYKADWEAFLKRIGRWSEYENYYATVDRDYTESVWWVMKQIHDRGLLKRGFKSMPYCPRCETPLSNFELNEGYQDNVTDPSLYVKFKLKDEDAYLLAWTTTPWSLPGNAAIAVDATAKYVYVELMPENNSKEILILAKDRLSLLESQKYKVLKELKGSELTGKKYQPLFNYKKFKNNKLSENMYKIWSADFVSTEDGTGVLHVAPAFGEDDLNLGEEHGLEVIKTVDSSGRITDDFSPNNFAGKFFRKANEDIIAHLSKAGNVFLAENIQHTYPFCYRCDSPLLYYAVTTWFVAVSTIRDKLIKTAESINWVPANIKEGRFGKWLEGAKDWAISRNRYWGAPMPVWVNENDDNDYIVVEGIKDLKKLAGNDIDVEDLHRPYIDNIQFTKDGKTYKRVEEVIDCWFESGSMSVAQHHYPFENKEEFNRSFPADFIIEGLDQTRLWFYVQHVIATILFDKPAYKNVVVNGMIMAADGQKLSKRLKNYPPTEDVFHNEGADAWRLYLLSSSQATETADYMRFDRDGMKDVQRNVLMRLLNSYNFFEMYAQIDEWKPNNVFNEPTSSNILDKWILSRVNEVIRITTKSADDYKIAHAIDPVISLIDDLSNWYIRRSRRRFWRESAVANRKDGEKSEQDEDKNNAYATLWYSLVTICKLLAPWAPFFSDYLYRKLVKNNKNLPSSVHLCDWPEAGNVDKKILESMKTARGIINEGLAQRAEAGIKVRQPLESVNVEIDTTMPNDLLVIIMEELNLKKLPKIVKGKGNKVELNTTITQSLKLEGISRDLIRHIQNLRKESKLNVDDRILLAVSGKDKLIDQIIKEFGEVIQRETLALGLSKGSNYEYSKKIFIDKEDISISLEIAKERNG
ncbi:isoleucine--tRNA ligase [Candidatus Saccharibacteria bacterium CPR2]|nr:isoleucine--tRNA ligase [Candidatus Saccharibacteria bacterium CPR2]